ncbi:MAG TPA: hypothetical protein VFX59_01765 [Polyangiales bacterium]|nr:hypothetical protein [Polyangiales bacterium]
MLRVAFYLALSVASTWPLAWRLASHYPRGAEPVATVPLASAWALWWTSDRAAHGFVDYWHAPIFWPVQDAFALSEPMPLLGLLAAPVLWLGLPLVLAYNLVLLAMLTANGVFAERLLRGLRVSPAWAGGALVCVLPGLHHELGVLTLVPLAGVLACLHYAFAIVRTGRGGVGLGVAFAATYLCCAQYALLLALALLPFLRWRRSFAVAALIASVTLAPIVVAQQRAVQAHQLVRSEQRVRDGSARLGDYAIAPPALLPPPVHVDRGSNTALYPGTLHLVLAVIGASWALRRRRRTAVLLLSFAAITFVLSISPRLVLAGHSLHAALAAVVPGLAQVRSIWRAGLFVQLALALFAAFGLHALQRRRYLTIAIGLALLEVWPRAQHLTAAPDEAAYARWAAFMRQSPGEPYCLLPFANNGYVRAFEQTAQLMTLTRLHQRPMLNGYSSYFPEPHEQLWRAPPKLGDASSAARLRARGVRQVVSSDDALWPVLFRDDATGIRVYAVP